MRDAILRNSLGLAMGACLLTACGGSPTAPRNDDVFYLHGGGVIDKNESWEVYFPPLDSPASPRVPRSVGVGIFRGDVRMTRPLDWSIRAADYTAQQRFISYQSPREFLFSIYERVDPPTDTWPEVLKRYEATVEDQGSSVLASRIPTATANSQGRLYLLKTRVRARPDYEGFAHEILVRNDKRVLLVQIVHRENIEAIADEMTSVLKSITVY